MSCYHPLNALWLGNKPDGKKIIGFLGHPVNDSQTKIYYRGKWYDRDRLLKIPCGQCVGCRIDYSRQWANRCMLELQYHDSAYFVTFTYDDDHVPRTYYDDPETGEAFPALTLRKRDFQLLMKRIRKRFDNDQIRYFACGEYGSDTFRPHYHAIIFGLHLDDLQLYKMVKQGGEYYRYYNSPSLSECWQDKDGNPIGYVVVGEVTWESCAYTARYVMKKLKGKEAEFYEAHNIVPEFTLMSRRPGIGRLYYEEHPDMFDFTQINISTPKGGKSFKPPRYFEKLFEVDNPAKYYEIKEAQKRLAIASKQAKLQNTSLYEDELNEVEESNKVAKLKQLRRSL